jgi:hypothetical protein
VSAVPSTIEQPAVAPPRQPGAGVAAHLLVLGCFVLGAVAMTWRLWLDPTGRLQAGDIEDVNLFTWFMRYSATAVSHGHLPQLLTTALNPPRGVNMMWQTAFMLPGILLAPVTLLAGPQFSLTLLLTLSFAGSAAAMFWVLRRWGASLSAAALGGALYGFSPALVNSGTGHYHLVLAVLPPLIIDAVLRIVTGREAAGRRSGDEEGRSLRARLSAVRQGIWLGLLVAAQIFIGEEPLVYTAMAALILLIVIVLSYPRSVLPRAGPAALGLLTGAAVALLISGYPLWVQFRGPLREHAIMYGPWSGTPAFFVEPSDNVLFHTAASASAVSHYYLGLPEVLTYLGYPLIVVLIAAAVCFWRDPKVRIAAVTCAVLELCALGGGPVKIGGFRLSGSFMPYHWVQSLPSMGQLLPGRFSILGAGAAGAALAFSLDRARLATARAGGWQRGMPVAVATLALLPLFPLPYHAAPVPPVPAGYQAAFTMLRLPPDSRVLVIPLPLVSFTAPMRWQATTGEPESMIGGYAIWPGVNGAPSFNIGPTNTEECAALYLNKLAFPAAPVCPASTGLVGPGPVRSALAYWRPAAVVAVTGPGSALSHFLTKLFGPADFHAGRVFAWRL